MLDTDLAAALGLKREYDIRSTIKANAEELASFGPLPVTSGQSRGQAFTAFHLNEEQALLICMLSRTERTKLASLSR
ncbi:MULTISPECIES: hypothetical protein [Hyphomicrobiales]|uniref:hypothetical protein n=1 Tax=Methylobacterium sp. CCH7-A2 TaxID=1768789 RepID=UPI000834501A|nr:MULTISPECIES: hypothetical protein [Hyphomicrobiales]